MVQLTRQQKIWKKQYKTLQQKYVILKNRKRKSNFDIMNLQLFEQERDDPEALIYAPPPAYLFPNIRLPYENKMRLTQRQRSWVDNMQVLQNELTLLRRKKIKTRKDENEIQEVKEKIDFTERTLYRFSPNSQLTCLKALEG
jgi:prefoldin subunit 5